GTRRIKHLLAQEGMRVSRRRIGRLLAQAGLRCKTRRKCKAPRASGQAQTVAPNQLNREFTVDVPDKVYVGDMTYLPTRIPHPVNCESSAFFRMVFQPRRVHNHGRIGVPKQPQATHVSGRSESCLAYHPRSQCIPCSICPLSKRMPTNSASSASSITMCP